MKLLSVIVLGMSFGALTIAAEEPVPPKHTETKTDENSKKNPFSPSELMRTRAQKPVEASAPDASGAPAAPVVRALPVLEGVLVKGNLVLASFRLGSKSIVIEPRSVFTWDDVNYTFVGYANEVAVLTDVDGHMLGLRVVQQASSNPQRAPAPAPVPARDN